MMPRVVPEAKLFLGAMGYDDAVCRLDRLVAVCSGS